MTNYRFDLARTALIPCDFFPGSGAGHLKRCIALGGALKKRGIYATRILDTSAEPVADRLRDMLADSICIESLVTTTAEEPLPKLTCPFDIRNSFDWLDARNAPGAVNVSATLQPTPMDGAFSELRALPHDNRLLACLEEPPSMIRFLALTPKKE